MWVTPRICQALTGTHSFSLQLPNLHGYYWMGTTTASSHLSLLLCKIWVAKPAKNSTGKATSDTTNRLLPSKELLQWKRCEVERIPTELPLSMYPGACFLGMGREGWVREKCYFRYWLHQIQIFKRDGPVVTGEISNQDGKAMYWR